MGVEIGACAEAGFGIGDAAGGGGETDVAPRRLIGERVARAVAVQARVKAAEVDVLTGDDDDVRPIGAGGQVGVLGYGTGAGDELDGARGGRHGDVGGAGKGEIGGSTEADIAGIRGDRVVEGRGTAKRFDEDVAATERADRAVGGEVASRNNQGNHPAGGGGKTAGGDHEGVGFLDEDSPGGGRRLDGAERGVDIGCIGGADARGCGECSETGGDQVGSLGGGVVRDVAGGRGEGEVPAGAGDQRQVDINVGKIGDITGGGGRVGAIGHHDRAGRGGDRDDAGGAGHDVGLLGDAELRKDRDRAGRGNHGVRVGKDPVRKGNRAGNTGELDVAAGGGNVGGAGGVADGGGRGEHGNAVDRQRGDGANGEIAGVANTHGTGRRRGGEGRDGSIDRIRRSNADACHQPERIGGDVGQGVAGIGDRTGARRDRDGSRAGVDTRKGDIGSSKEADITACGGDRNVVREGDGAAGSFEVQRAGAGGGHGGAGIQGEAAGGQQRNGAGA